jgi:hypothetical protein
VGNKEGFSVILEGREGRGWRVCAAELRMVVAFLELSLGERSKTLFSWQSVSVCSRMIWVAPPQCQWKMCWRKVVAFFELSLSEE